jgi:hypothetical protein
MDSLSNYYECESGSYFSISCSKCSEGKKVNLVY